MPRSSSTVRPLTESSGSVGLRRGLVDPQEHLPPDHQPGQPLLGRARGGQRLDLLAAAQHGDPVRDLGDLVQLVADEDDRLSLLGQALDDREQLVRLLRGQHRGRLVEHEDVGAAVERLQDLDALLLADRDVPHDRARVDGEPEPRRDLAHALLRRRVVEQDPVVHGLGREHDVLGDRHHRDQHEVLVHHPDAVLDRRLGRAELGRLAVDPDLALVRVVEAVDDVHQRRLAGAVLAEQRVHLALAQVEVDAVVRDDAGEALRDPTKLENGPLVHRGDSMALAAGGPRGTRLLDGLGDVRDLARGDPVLDPVHLRDDVGRHVGGDLAEPDATRGDVEDRVLAALRSCRPATAWIVWKTATSTFFSALVSTCSPR